MKRSAVLGHTLAIALATAAAGVALAAGPANADETSQLALAPLPQVLTGASLFGQVKQGEPKGEQKGEEKGEGEEGGGKKGECRDDWRLDHVNYRFHPVGYTLPKNVTSLTDLTPNYPNGFVAKHFNELELSRGLGGGLEVGISASEAREFGLKAGAVLNPHPHDSVWFLGGYMQKKLVSEKGLLPTISIGGRVNQGDDELLSYGVYLVGTKRILGKPCQTPGVWITSGYKWDGYTTDTEEGLTLAEITPVGRPVPGLDNSGARPFEGLNIAFSKNLFVSGEWSHREPWQFHDMWSARGILLVYKGWGVSGGVEDNGFHERTFVGLELGSFSSLIGGGRGR